MIKEIVQFMQSLDDDFKNLGVKSKEGLHILLKMKDNNGKICLDKNTIQYEIYSKKMYEESIFLKKCKFLCLNAWMIDTNKCFDVPTKAIHSCSPYCVGFKREHLEGGEKYKKNKLENKKQIEERFGLYFMKSSELLQSDEDKLKIQVFKNFFDEKDDEINFKNVLMSIEMDCATKRKQYEFDIETLKEKQKQTSDKIEKNNIRILTEEVIIKFESVKELTDKDYIIFYLDEPIESYKKFHKIYLSNNLFNKADFNTKSNDNEVVFGVSNFFNSIDSGGNKLFLKHQTATFEITGRVSNVDSASLYEFEDLLKRKILPKPLPIFIYKEELQKEVIGIFKESNFKIGYREIIEKLWSKYNTDIGNYYLLYYQNTKDGMVFKDFDFVSKFEYELKHENKPWDIEDLFDIKFNHKIHTIFDFQSIVLQIVFNNNLIVRTKDGLLIEKYFDDIDKDYCKSIANYLSILKYRQSLYNFIFKSKRNSITKTMFDDMLKTSIMEDIRLDEIKNNKHSEYLNIRKKLNIWFSLYEKFTFNNKQETTMASKLNEYRTFVADLADDKANIEKATIEQFAFASGQVIEYILKKSKSADQSYQLLEPYLQQSKCDEFKKAISNDFARYKHEKYSRRFENVASFVLTFNTDENIKKLLPEILAGVFSNNQLFGHKENKDLVNNNQENNDE